MGIPRIAMVQERLVPSKKKLREMERSIEKMPYETAEWALGMLEDIRHDAREGWHEKFDG